MAKNGDGAAVRRATASDAAALAPMVDRYRVFYRMESDEAGCERFLRARLERGESVVFVAECAGSPAGFTQLYPLFATTTLQRKWLLNDLFVDPSFRRRGIAAALLEAAESFARSEDRGVEYGVRSIELRTELDNTSARALYDGAGWSSMTEFVAYKKML